MLNYKHHFYFETVTGEIFSLNKEYALAFLEPEKALNQVPRDLVWLTLKKLEKGEWLV